MQMEKILSGIKDLGKKSRAIEAEASAPYMQPQFMGKVPFRANTIAGNELQKIGRGKY